MWVGEAIVYVALSLMTCFQLNYEQAEQVAVLVVALLLSLVTYTLFLVCVCMLSNICHLKSLSSEAHARSLH